jgi:hypothetical protein
MSIPELCPNPPFVRDGFLPATALLYSLSLVTDWQENSMDRLRAWATPLAYILVVTLFSFGLGLPSAQAALVGTDAVIAAEHAGQERARLISLLERDDVRAELQANGVDPHAARARVASLTDAEVHSIVGKIDQVPAGGDVLGLLVLVFLVLLFTDIMGWTNVFPFVKKHAR